MSTEALVFNPSDPAFIANPYPIYRRLRNEAPVHWWERGRMWLLSRYADVEATLKDSRFTTDIRRWSLYQEQQGMPAKFVEVSEYSIVQVSRDDHTRIRKLVMPSFTPRAVEKREALVQQVIDELLPDAGGTEVFDLVQSFAEELPIRVISRILGIPPEHDATFRRWGQVLIQVSIPVLPLEQRIALAQQIPAGFELLERVIDERRANPTDDLLSSLIHAQEEGHRLDAKELLSLVGGLITAGSETTVHLLAFAVLELLRHPDVLARVRGDHALLPAAIEEVLRHDNFGKTGAIPRYPLEDVEVRGQVIQKGDMVMCLIPAAMHDEDVYTDPERFDIERESTPNLSFGRGAHFCLGAHLARIETRVALQTLLTRYPNMSLASEPQYSDHPFIRSMTTLPIRLRPVGQA
jgi:cytochrome P450 enzyme